MHPYLTFRGPATPSRYAHVPRKPARLYLTSIRIGTLVHTLAFAIHSPSQATFDAALPAATAIVSSLSVAAVPVLPLSPLQLVLHPGVLRNLCRRS